MKCYSIEDIQTEQLRNDYFTAIEFSRKYLNATSISGICMNLFIEF